MSRSRTIDGPSGRTRAAGGRWCALLILLAALGASPAVVAGPVEQDLSREEIGGARARAEARYQQQRWECSRRFIVTSCMEDARAEHRATVQALDRREAEIDRTLRHQRAQQRLAIIEQKTASLARQAPLPSADRPQATPQPDAAESERQPRADGHAAGPRSNEVAAAERAARARAEASQRRRAEAEQRRAEREQRRQAEQKKPAAGLPERPLIPLPTN
ncbi:hypothetical protein [Piscinibacter sakaiensis]|uniref:hypothetical protein n=1 Tax=Piscinibacter sakaiensis TaxID=1547922 RepID=UPI003AB09C84